MEQKLDVDLLNYVRGKKWLTKKQEMHGKSQTESVSDIKFKNSFLVTLIHRT